MDNLHRPLAPISAAAWEEIEEEARRTLCRYMGARRVVDLCGPHGYAHSSVNLGHRQTIESGIPGVHAAQRVVLPLVELKVPFALRREDIDDVARGAGDSDWQPLKDAALQLAMAENMMVFDGLKSAGIAGMRALSSNAPVPMPEEMDEIPEAVARAVDSLRRAGEVGAGVLVLVCAMQGDGEAEAEKLAQKLARLRIFRDEKGDRSRRCRGLITGIAASAATVG